MPNAFSGCTYTCPYCLEKINVGNVMTEKIILHINQLPFLKLMRIKRCLMQASHLIHPCRLV
ncbi:hypothetical protein [Vallitalea longa]|uniref:hypothetical protein n=1 Tax=Vallitalea longa TaxID=2936439 RepID=UPI0024928617|nr:hypothetical protein [Vallitalea longa]